MHFYFAFKIDSWDQIGGHVSSSIDHSNKTTRSRYRYNVYVGKDKHLFFVVKYTQDTDHPEKVGLYSIKVFNTKDEEPSFRSAGIYMPEEQLFWISFGKRKTYLSRQK